MMVLVAGIVVFIVAYQRKVMGQKFEIQENETRHQKELLSAALQTQELERARIAKDLHDEIGAMLSAVKMNVNLVGRRLKKNGVEEDPLVESRSMLDEAIVGVRRISHDLMPPALENLGLPAALEEFGKKVEKTTGLRFSLQLSRSLPKLDKETRLTLFRLVQEMTNNTLKHAEATVLELNITARAQTLHLTFSDNGKGFEVETARRSPSSLGLKSLESRTNFLKGNLEITSTPGTGTTINITTPLPGNAQLDNPTQHDQDQS